MKTKNEKWELAKSKINPKCMNYAFKKTELDKLPKSAIYDALKKNPKTREFSKILLDDIVKRFRFTEFSVSAGYMIFDDNSLYGYLGCDSTVFSDYQDYVQDIIIPLDESELQSADKDLICYSSLHK